MRFFDSEEPDTRSG